MATGRTLLVTLLCLYKCTISLAVLRPNILFVLIDDLGWNDVSYHGGSDFETPHLDELARGALQLNNYYVQHYCTPTRSALMSGRYPMRDGMQQWVIRSTSGYGMPLELTTLPEELKATGYSTHLLGKWHLGFFDPDYTPTHRGFDTFIGYYGDKEDYYMKNNSEWAVFPNMPLDESLQQVSGFDFRNGDTASVNEEYSTYLYANETLNLLKDHVSNPHSEPMFILWSSQAAHDPYDAPQDVKDRFSDIEDENRRELAAVIAVLDESLGDIVEYLKSEESGMMWDDTMIIVSTDNGGSVTKGSSNFPLRGGKKTLWEGGIRATGFITGGWLPEGRRGAEMNALMHVTDWLPTLLSIVGAEPTGPLPLDGYDQSLNIINGEMDIYHPREEILHNVLLHGDLSSDGTTSSCYAEFCGAIRWRDFKLILGTDSAMKYSDDTLCANSWCEIAEPEVASVAQHSVMCSIGNEDSNYQYPDIAADSCLFNNNPCLFNVMSDPCEWIDLRKENREVVDMLTRKLKQYNDTQTFPLYRQYPENATMANPAYLEGFWGPWQNVEIDRSQSVVTKELPKMGPRDRMEQHQNRRKRTGQKRQSHEVSEGIEAVAVRVNSLDSGNTVRHSVDRNMVMSIAAIVFLVVAVMTQMYRWWQSRKIEKEYVKIEDGRQRSTTRYNANENDIVV